MSRRVAERGQCRQAGELAVAALAGFGVDTMFTLNGGHVWPLYDGARTHGVRIIDTRHEQSAKPGLPRHGPSSPVDRAWLCLSRRPGSHQRRKRDHLRLFQRRTTGGNRRARPLQARWGSGSLQELDHVPIVATVTKTAFTVIDPAEIARAIQSAVLTALTPHRGPVFVDVPMDVLFASAQAEVPNPGHPPDIEPDPEEIARAAAMIADVSRPAVIAGSDVYWAAMDALARAVEHLRVPCFANGMGRGCLPADHGSRLTAHEGCSVRGGHGGGDRHAPRLPARLRPIR